MTSWERAWRGGRNDWRLIVLSVFSVAVAFICLAAALLVVVNVDALRDRWAQAGRASVYLKPAAEASQIRDIERALRDSPGVREARFVSSEEARYEVTSRTPDDVLGALPPEAFPASIEVMLNDDVQSTRVDQLAIMLKKLPAVDTVETYKDWSARLAVLMSGGVTAALFLAVIVLGAVVSVVASTIRLAMQRRSIEIEVLKLVGATDSYVRRPFVIDGAVQGALGAALAVALLGGLFLIVRGKFAGELALLIGVSPRFLPWHAVLAMLGLGGVLGALAAYGSLRKMLVV